MLRTDLVARLQRLQQKRAELVQTHAVDLAELDTQIAATQDLIRDWTTMTVDQAFTRFAAAGLRVKVER